MASINNKHLVGLGGESLAAQFLISHNYSILEKNWRSGHLEIDIIASQNNTLHFVEVKTRTLSAQSSITDFSPEAAMTPAKAARIMSAAQQYINIHNFQGETSLDLLAIILDTHGQCRSIQHYTDLQWSF